MNRQTVDAPSLNAFKNSLAMGLGTTVWAFYGLFPISRRPRCGWFYLDLRVTWVCEMYLNV